MDNFNRIVIKWLSDYISFEEKIMKKGSVNASSIYDLFVGMKLKQGTPIILFKNIKKTKKCCGVYTVNYLFMIVNNNYTIPLFNVWVHNGAPRLSQVFIGNYNSHNDFLNKKFVGRFHKYYTENISKLIEKILFPGLKASAYSDYMALLLLMSLLNDEENLNKIFKLGLESGSIKKLNIIALSKLKNLIKTEKFKELPHNLQETLVEYFTPFSLFLLLNTENPIWFREYFKVLINVPLYFDGEFLLAEILVHEEYVKKLSLMCENNSLKKVFDFIGDEFYRFVRGQSDFMFLLKDAIGDYGRNEVIKQLVSSDVTINLGSFMIKFSITPNDKLVMQVYKVVYNDDSIVKIITGLNNPKYSHIFDNNMPEKLLVYVRDFGVLKPGLSAEKLKSLSVNGNGCLCFDGSHAYIFNAPKYSMLHDKKLHKYVRVIDLSRVEHIYLDGVKKDRILIKYVNGESEVIEQKAYFIGNYNEVFDRNSFHKVK